MTALTPVQAAAMAAERRMHDDLWCGSGCQENLTAVENENGKLEYSTFEDLGVSSKNTNVSQGKHHISRDSCNSDKGQSSSYTNSQNVSTFVKGTSGAHVSSGSSSCGRMDDAEDKVIWECTMCTLFNQPLAPVCEACGTKKPKAIGSKFKTWSCKFCTLENDNKLEKCSACDQWRYSYGPPVSTRASNYGT